LLSSNSIRATSELATFPFSVTDQNVPLGVLWRDM
jgi:hypothetical protein